MNSRQKGSVAERFVAMTFREWWAKYEPKDADGKPIAFVRTPLSGGWGGPAVRAGFLASGDLMTTAKRWPFAVEVKRREGWGLANLINGRPCPVWGWWAQCRGAALEMRREPLMLFRKSHTEWKVMMRERLAAQLFNWGGATDRKKRTPETLMVWDETVWMIGMGAYGYAAHPACVGLDDLLALPPQRVVLACQLAGVGAPRTGSR